VRDRDLVRLYWPAELRPAFDALFAIDDAMGDVVARASEPALAAIKLAWWRERLEELDDGAVPAEPRLRAAAEQLLPRGISGGDLSQLEEGWRGLLYDPPDMALVTEHGTRLFMLGARLLGVPFDDERLGVAGRLFAGVAAARRGLVDLAAGSPGFPGPRSERQARALTGLAALAARDLRHGGPPFEPEATPGRAWTLIRHRLTGRIA
jgi:15-cis-phytoene synthase